MSGYSSGSHANEDWLVSPELDFTGFISGNFTFDNAYKYDGNPLLLMVSTDYDGSSSPETFTWNDISGSANWSDGNYDWVSSDVDLSEYLGQKIYLAFKYTSTDDASSTWEVDNLFVFGVKATGVDENNAGNVSIYPNPATGYFNLSSNLNGTLTMIDISGRVVLSKEIVSGNNTIDISTLTNGIYISNVVLSNGSKTTAKIMVK
jgi:hypothetical protein